MEKVLSNPLKDALKRGKPQYGCWLNSTTPMMAEIAATCGYDWLLYDGEHGPNDTQSLFHQLQAADGYKSHAVCRIPENHDATFKLVLDMGFKTIMVPLVDNKAKAEAAVRAMTYPPVGVRGVGALVGRATRWNSVPDYARKVQDTLCLVAQIETVEAVSNLDEIASVPGVDVMFIGPADLATSMGFYGDFNRPEVLEAIESTIKRIVKLGKVAGAFTMGGLSRQCLDWGALFVSVASDLLVYKQGLSDRLAQFNPEAKVEY
jgi:2-dehydro-3-deoxy-L-rhamnonate aldolase